ncbi:DedA family protein [Holospora curviuscula]|uniref:Inner membrane protein YohD n=1 Tax=Holospora curviuscula TaxID=1082868 RepID=A0A2S5R9J0_9PROT|nr:VTT domain-containing protein [Holospora curviuscula]PPE03970.1 Inner membrane protein YohD [Holospora curviuscula]
MKSEALKFLQDYGYWAVFLGSLIEGESIILTSSAMAAAGYFSIQKIMIIAFCGTLLADQSLYLLGYVYGPGVLTWIRFRLPKMTPYIDKALIFLARYQNIYILSFRFIWGVRIISSIIIGAQKVPVLRFAILNVVAAAVWTVVSCMAGFLIGETLLYGLENYGGVVSGSLVLGGIFTFFVWKIWKKRAFHIQK